MRRTVYAVKDMRTKLFGDPFIDENDASALRGFSYAINGGNQLMTYSPADFRLFKIGEWDPTLAIIYCLDTGVELIAAGEDVKKED